MSLMDASKNKITSTPVPLWKNLNIDDGTAQSDADKYGGLFDANAAGDERCAYETKILKLASYVSQIGKFDGHAAEELKCRLSPQAALGLSDGECKTLMAFIDALIMVVLEMNPSHPLD
jgi:hypothetical protein